VLGPVFDRSLTSPDIFPYRLSLSLIDENPGKSLGAKQHMDPRQSISCPSIPLNRFLEIVDLSDSSADCDP
jgi:hypothetical protein